VAHELPKAAVVLQVIFVDVDCVAVVGAKLAVARLEPGRRLARELLQQDVADGVHNRLGALPNAEFRQELQMDIGEVRQPRKHPTQVGTQLEVFLNSLHENLHQTSLASYDFRL